MVTTAVGVQGDGGFVQSGDVVAMSGCPGTPEGLSLLILLSACPVHSLRGPCVWCVH